MRGVNDDGGRNYHVVFRSRPDAPGIPRDWVLQFKTPAGRSESASIDAPGHTVVANVDNGVMSLMRTSNAAELVSYQLRLRNHALYELTLPAASGP